jgi:hypothetical protein
MDTKDSASSIGRCRAHDAECVRQGSKQTEEPAPDHQFWMSLWLFVCIWIRAELAGLHIRPAKVRGIDADPLGTFPEICEILFIIAILVISVSLEIRFWSRQRTGGQAENQGLVHQPTDKDGTLNLSYWKTLVKLIYSNRIFQKKKKIYQAKKRNEIFKKKSSIRNSLS